MTTSISAQIAAAQAALTNLQSNNYPAGSSAVAQAQYAVALWQWLAVVFANQSTAANLVSAMRAMNLSTLADANSGAVMARGQIIQIAGQNIDLSTLTA